ncbi:MAG: carboxypeptidase regulatory-like domain-containing protein [Planctomycetes bacterium]|nr:carboxypeptidase regulatory-like domain-containing protein [Planctomycetota bacterium]
MRRVAFWCLFVILLGCASWCEGGEYPYRLFYVSSKLDNDGEVGKVCSVVRSAAGAGFNGMVFSSPGLERLGVEFSGYAKRLKEVASVCKENNIEIIPMVFSLNSDDSTVFHDKNLVEGLPVKDAPFIVWNGDAVLVPDQSVRFPNGGFEDYVGDQIKLYQLQDVAVQVIFADKSVHKEGKASLRFEKQEQDAGTKGYVAQEVRVKPYRSYKVTFWVKTEGLRPATSFLPQVHGKDSRILMELNPVLQPDGEWRKMTFGFNSCDNTTVKIYLGLSNWVSGKLWIDDLSIEEAAPLNVLSRPGTPTVVRNKKTGTIYEDAYDFAPIVDSKMNFRFDHEEPLVKIIPNSSIKDDDRLLISFYQGIALHESQVTFCMSEPKLYEIWRSQAHAIHEAIAPNKYFLNVTQVRAGGTCEACKQRGISMAQILGDCITRQMSIVRELNPNAEVFIWSDMLDDNHNARNNFYLVDGDLTGSWNYIPKDLIIACWYHKLRNESMHHFSSRGFKTLACVNSDKGADEIRDWLQVMKKTPDTNGAMYTSFENDYTKLASFGRVVLSDMGDDGWLDVSVPNEESKQAIVSISENEDADKPRVEVVTSVHTPTQEIGDEKHPSVASATTITANSEQNQQIVTSPTAKGTNEAKPRTNVSVSPHKNAGSEQSPITVSSSEVSGAGRIITVSSSTTPDVGHKQTVEPVVQNEVVDKPRVESVTTVPAPAQESVGSKQPSVASATTIIASSEQGRQVASSPTAKGTSEAKSKTPASVSPQKNADIEQSQIPVSSPLRKTTGDAQFKVPTGNKDNKITEPEAPSLRTKAAIVPSPHLNKSGGMGVVFGLVGGNDDEVMKGVKIKIEGTAFSDYTVTDEDGFFEFSNLSAGDYAITQEKDDYQTQRIIINLEEGEVVDLGTITMGTTRSYIYGYVRDSIRGNPIGTATIKLKGLKTKSKNTSFSDTDGFFKFADLGEDTYVLIARKRGFKRLNRTIRLSKGEERELELEMRTRIRKEKDPSKVTLESNKGKVLEAE